MSNSPAQTGKFGNKAAVAAAKLEQTALCLWCSRPYANVNGEEAGTCDECWTLIQRKIVPKRHDFPKGKTPHAR